MPASRLVKAWVTKDKVHADWSMRWWIIAVLLSGFPPETEFKTRGKSGWLDNYLDQQIREVLDGCGIKSVEKVFHFYTNKYGSRWCDELDMMLSVFMMYGATAGLENWGLDFDYRTTEKTIKVAKEAKKYMPKKDFEALRELGLKKLYVCRPRKYRGKPYPC